jgi:heat shock protein HslJ
MMRRRHSAIALAGILFVYGLTACETPTATHTRDATAGLPDLQQDLAAHEWLLDADDSSPRSRAAEPVTLAFDGAGGVSGTGPCNIYRGDLSVDDDDDTIVITNLAQTKRACALATMRAEQEYLDALQSVRDVDLSDGYHQRHLVLTNDAGERLAFTAIDAREQLLGSWNVVNVVLDDAIRSVIAGTEPALVFEDDGDVILDAGCNTARGSFELERDRLTVEDLKQTRKHCDTPAGVMEQEAALVDALASASQIQVVPGTLTLVDENGAIVLVATAALETGRR